jgi:hypothetical protein
LDPDPDPYWPPSGSSGSGSGSVKNEYGSETLQETKYVGIDKQEPTVGDPTSTNPYP